MAPASSQVPEPHRGDASDGEALFDRARLGERMELVQRSLVRHLPLAAGALLVSLAASVVALWALPKTWHAEAKILVRQIGSRQSDGRSPRGEVADVVLKRDDLIALVKQTQAVEALRLNRAPAEHVTDFIGRLLSGSEMEEPLESVVGSLEKKLMVYATDATVVLALDWPDATSCFRIVDAAQKNFIEARHALEVSSIAEAIAILESHASEARAQVEGATEELHRATAALPVPRPVRAAPNPRRAVEPDRGELGPKQAAIRAVDESLQSHTRLLNEQQAQLATLGAELGPLHPRIAEARRHIAVLQEQVAQLAQQQKSLRDELAAWRAAQPPPPPPARAPQDRAEERAPVAQAEVQDLEGVRNRLRSSTQQYENLRRRIDAAQIELDTTEANFTRRYSVLQSAQMPKRPKSPQPALVLGAGAVGGLGLALLLCVAVERRSARRLEG